MRRLGFIVGDKGSCAQTSDMNDLERVAREFKERDIDILGISGGDGTNHRTLTTFIQVYGEKPLPKITFLRGGTLNTIATGCGIHGSPEKILSNLIYKYHEDESFTIRKIRLIQINNDYGFIWGCGVIYRFMDAYYKKGEGSPMNAAKTLVQSIGSAIVNGPFACRMFERFDADVTVNGERWAYKNYSALYAASVPYLGLNFKTFYLVDKGGDAFHAIGFSMPPRNILPYMPLMFLGRPSGCPNLLEEPAQTMEMNFSEPIPYT
ncbi:MAG: diacylglycerol kinase family protein, partial [Deltaproteobacteria bacterium]|nr:diacylglycerol kinase family protein [Deltaproteobacteria bacterium]